MNICSVEYVLLSTRNWLEIQSNKRCFTKVVPTLKCMQLCSADLQTPWQAELIRTCGQFWYYLMLHTCAKSASVIKNNRWWSSAIIFHLLGYCSSFLLFFFNCSWCLLSAMDHMALIGCIPQCQRVWWTEVRKAITSAVWGVSPSRHAGMW